MSLFYGLEILTQQVQSISVTLFYGCFDAIITSKQCRFNVPSG